MGTDLMKGCKEVFELDCWSSSYGGSNWANIANTALMYLTGEISKTTFVDTTWGLQHNGNICLDKVWSVKGLRRVLDYNLSDDMKGLLKWASEETKNVIRKSNLARKSLGL